MKSGLKLLAGDYCMPGEVSMDSESSADANILAVEVRPQVA